MSSFNPALNSCNGPLQQPVDAVMGLFNAARIDRVLRVATSQEFRFLLVGAINTIIGYTLFVVALTWFGRSIGPTLSLVLSYCIALPVSFLTQRVFVFRVNGNICGQFLRFSFANSLIFVANVVFLPLAILATRYHPLVLQGVFVVASAIASYLAHKNFSFRRSK